MITMKILLCSPVVGISNSNPGGIAVWEKNIMDYHNGHPSDIEIDVQSCDRSRYINENTGKVKRLYCGIVDYSKIIRDIKIKLRKGNYDAIHLCTTASISLIKDYLIFKYAKRKRLRTILHFHFGRIPELAEAQTWEWRWLKKVLALTDTAIVIDRMSYDTLMRCGYNNVVSVPNPLAPELVQEIESNRGTERENHLVLFVSRVFKKKGIYELVKACKEIPNIKLKVVGHVEDTDKEALESIAGHGSWLTFIGGIPHKDVIKELLACDIYVLPTYTEGFPNAIIESMACGTPTVTTPVGAIPEMLDMEGEPCGICVPPKDVEQLREAIISLLDSPGQKKLFAERSQKRVNELYSIESVWNQLYKVWKS